MTIQSKPAPFSGAPLVEYDHITDEWVRSPREILAVVNQGIHGWIVELDSHEYIEVVPSLELNGFREITSQERHASRRPKDRSDLAEDL